MISEERINTMDKMYFEFKYKIMNGNLIITVNCIFHDPEIRNTYIDIYVFRIG